MATVTKVVLKTNNKLEQLQIYIRFMAVVNSIILSDMEVIFLSHFMLEGYNRVSKEELLKQKVVSSYQMLHNKLSLLRSKGILKKDMKGEKLTAPFDKKLEDITLLMVKLDNK